MHSDSSLPVVGSPGGKDPLEGTSSGSLRFKLTLEQADELVAAIYDTWQIK